METKQIEHKILETPGVANLYYIHDGQADCLSSRIGGSGLPVDLACFLLTVSRSELNKLSKKEKKHLIKEFFFNKHRIREILYKLYLIKNIFIGKEAHYLPRPRYN